MRMGGWTRWQTSTARKTTTGHGFRKNGTSKAYTKRNEKGGRMERTRDANVHADENDESATYAETKTKGSTLLRNHSRLQGPSGACSLPIERLVAVSQGDRTIQDTQSTRKRSRKAWPLNLSRASATKASDFVAPYACLYFIVSENERGRVHAFKKVQERTRPMREGCKEKSKDCSKSRPTQ